MKNEKYGTVFGTMLPVLVVVALCPRQEVGTLRESPLDAGFGELKIHENSTNWTYALPTGLEQYHSEAQGDPVTK